MLRFNLFGFPVEIHWMFWLVAGLLGSSGATGLAEVGINPGAYLVMWVAVVLVSILVHECGHAIFQRKFLRARPRIMLYSFGGLAIPEGGRMPTRGEAIVISAMGPAFGLALAGIVWLVAHRLPSPGLFAHLTIGALLWVNVAWSILNLLPVLPLDGGRIMEAVVPGRSPLLPYRISMVVAGAVSIVFFFLLQQMFAGLLFGYLAYTNYQRTKGFYPPTWRTE